MYLKGDYTAGSRLEHFDAIGEQGSSGLAVHERHAALLKSDSISHALYFSLDAEIGCALHRRHTSRYLSEKKYLVSTQNELDEPAWTLGGARTGSTPRRKIHKHPTETLPAEKLSQIDRDP